MRMHMCKVLHPVSKVGLHKQACGCCHVGETKIDEEIVVLPVVLNQGSFGALGS